MLDPCEEWPKSRNTRRGGYGQINWKGRIMPAHRWAWEQAHGPIPNGMWVLHRCDNPPCIKVTHLFLGTQTDNMRDASSKNRLRGRHRGFPNRKLTTEQVGEIRASGDMNIVLAKRYSVRPDTISKIKNWHIRIHG